MNIVRYLVWFIVIVIMLLALGSRVMHAQSFEVRVLDGRSGDRIPNEKVSVLVKGEKGAREYKTDNNGAFAVTMDPSAYIYVATEWRVTCRRVTRGVVPYISVATIMREGVTEQNTCGHAKSETIKNKLVIFTRKASFFENFKR